MELKEVLLKRRSIRKFTAEKVSDEDIKELLIAGMSGPSACNARPWEFYVVTNQNKLQEIRGVSKSMNIESPLAIIVCGNLENALKGEAASYWIQDTSAAIENILLRVTDLGLGAVWCGTTPQQEKIEGISKVLNLNSNIIPLGVILIGHPDTTAEPRSQYDEGKVHFIN